ncbi:MAG: hypothetical protein WC028_22850 [Candidatus Obscuribacterales bacterium]
MILSPRDIPSKNLQTIASDAINCGADILFDPQFYLPHADHKTLCEHSYWPKNYSTGAFFAGYGLSELLDELGKLNSLLGSIGFILPGIHASTIDDAWLKYHKMIAEAAVDKGFRDGFKLFATVALSAEALVDDDQVHELLEEIESWPVDGIYLVCEHPKGEYLVSDTNWLVNQLDLSAGLRLQGKEVISGYSNHQSLILATASVNAIASGTWMNVRSFPPEKFVIPPEEIVKTKSIWYYCPHALSEFKITFLDVASRQGILSEMMTPAAFGSSFADSLFVGVGRPSLVGLNERNSFLHYLQCLNVQTAQSRLSTFDATVDAYNQMLDSAEQFLSLLHDQGVRGQNRDFSEIIDVNRAAIATLKSTRGPMLKRKWGSL